MKKHIDRFQASFFALSIFLSLPPTSEALCSQKLAIGFAAHPLGYSSRRRDSSARVPFLLHPKPGRSNNVVLRISDSATKLSEANLSNGDEEREGIPPTPNKDQEGPQTVSIASDPVSKFRQLKDLMWTREALEDVTAAEFALSVESAQEELGRKKKRAVDYEKLLSNLNRKVGDMICLPFEEINGSGVPEILEDRGMGRFAYTQEQRVALLKKMLATRDNLMEIVESHNAEHQEEREESSFGFELPEIPKVEIPKVEDTLTPGPKLYVRDDGTVDWEGALQDRAALKQFGGAVWARINGQIPDEIPDEDDEGEPVRHEKPAVTAKIIDTPAIRGAREQLEQLQTSLKDQQKANVKLLTSGISAGQAVANVKLASLDPQLRNKIRVSSESLHIMEQKVSYQNLVYELERIYTYLATELGNPAAKGYVPLQDRLNVAEYGLLEGQVQSCSRELNEKGTLDPDIIAVITDQMIDFKRRLGIDYYVTGLTYDREAIQTWMSDIMRKTKSGIYFYVKGCRLFWNDILYCSSLIARAAQGYTLKPREVRTIRRTFKDIITFIPVVIILIIPLSPVGHVLVFGAIQRFFPGFFPSCFTEQRQNLLELYETAEYSEFTINETLQERFTRFLEAVAFSVASSSRGAYKKVLGPRPDNESTDEKK